MPTKKKRVGFIPRDEVMKIIEKLSLENNLSNSKIINILVEEALCYRGIYDFNYGNADQKPNQNNKFDHKTASHNVFRNNLIKSSEMDIIRSKFKNIDDSFDYLTYEKFLLFLKFQEMKNRFEG